MKTAKFKERPLWCVEFWDNGAWNEYADTRRHYKSLCVEMAQRMNRATPDWERKQVFGGHRYRVRRVKV